MVQKAKLMKNKESFELFTSGRISNHCRTRIYTCSSTSSSNNGSFFSFFTLKRQLQAQKLTHKLKHESQLSKDSLKGVWWLGQRTTCSFYSARPQIRVLHLGRLRPTYPSTPSMLTHYIFLFKGLTSQFSKIEGL